MLTFLLQKELKQTNLMPLSIFFMIEAHVCPSIPVIFDLFPLFLVCKQMLLMLCKYLIDSLTDFQYLHLIITAKNLPSLVSKLSNNRMICRDEEQYKCIYKNINRDVFLLAFTLICCCLVTLW